MSNQQENKRIAKNTLFMYFRMLLVLVVSLYTSRVVLQQLGIDDFGIYSVIGGVITLFTFFNQAMSTSTQRYITYELGKPDGNVSLVFSACMRIHIAMAFAVIILAETIGLWFVNYKMVFPTGSMVAVNWTYQISIFICVITILRFPYNALVIAHEKMSFYAYNSIVEVTLKLGIVFLLILAAGNKLVIYMILLAIVTTIITVWYCIYCRKQFPGVKLIRVTEKRYYKEIVSFSGWATFGSVANVGYQQGVVVIINLFYGVAVNAAIGLANQVNAAVTQFVSGFQQALNPQLIKSQAAGDRGRQMQLIRMSAKFSFLIMLFVAYPLIGNIDYVLTLWLQTYPPATGVITSLIILGALLETLSGPLWVTIFATGKIRRYQMVVSMILLMNLPFAYLLGYLEMPVWQIFVLRILIFMVVLGVRLTFLKKLIDFNISEFLKKVILPLSLICAILGANFLSMTIYARPAEDFIQFLWQTCYYAAFASIFILWLGLSKSEYAKLKSIILNKIKR